ncbi:MAG TPA: N-acetylmuramoyl-L-alanine amidase [Gaiellaceae bacterium]|nr:N-acetylmuramoyl-L-alanine amidase [Gaiellaceae bacterium]
MRTLLAAFVLALAAPAAASAGLVSMHVRDVSLGSRSLSASRPAAPFDMLGVHWIGSGSVEYRTRSATGRWRPWRRVDADNRSGAWHDGDLDWTGRSLAVRFRVRGEVRRLRSYELDSRVLSAPVRATTSAEMPAIVTREAWHANEEIVRARPVIASRIRVAIVHHTAGTNSYTRSQSAAIVRGIEAYHVLGNGWNDIGYNFLVDRFGTVYEGRGGGIERNVVGAHAQGFNFGTVGVALIGSFNSTAPTAAQQQALVDLLAWRLDVAHLDPSSTVGYTSSGNYKFRAGRVVTLRAISGHRDTGPTECPGARAYALLPSLIHRVAVTGLPKLYSPEVVGVLGGTLRFRARLSTPLQWTVTVTDRHGAAVATGAGHGTFVDWSWRSGAAPPGPLAWVIAADGVRAATGTLGSGSGLPFVPSPVPSLSLTALASVPSVLAPAVDGSGTGATATFTLGSAANVRGQIVDAGGRVAATVLAEQRDAGPNSLSWSAAPLVDGRYRLVLTATAVGQSVTKAIGVVVDRTLSSLQASSLAISPNGDGSQDATSAAFVLTRAVPLRIDVLQGGAVRATIYQGTLGPGPQTIGWDGTAAGAALPDGLYQLAFTVTDALGDVRQTIPITIDDTPPALSLLDRSTLAFTLSEPAIVTLLVNGQSSIVIGEPAGRFTVPFAGPVTSVVARAQDFAGNSSATVSG